MTGKVTGELQRIVIVGGGAGGLELVARLSRLFKKLAWVQIILVDAKLTHLWKPLWHEVAAGTLTSYEDEINYLAFAQRQGFQFEWGKLIGLDRNLKQITLAPIFDQQGQMLIPQRIISYSTLVIAIGSISNHFNISGVLEHCHFLDSLDQVEHFHQLFLNSLMLGLHQQEKLPLRIAIIGGGATGVELAAELNDAALQILRYTSQNSAQVPRFQIIVVESANCILSNLPQRVIRATQTFLTEQGITLIEKARVSKVTQQGLYLENGLFISAQLKVWAAGIKAPEILENLEGLEVNQLKQLRVLPTLQTTRDPNIFALGDCASCLLPNQSRAVPPRAQTAHQQAWLLAKSLHRYLQGKALLEFTYHDYGSLISLSRYTAIGSLMGFRGRNVVWEGKLARWTYLGLYKLHQIVLFGIWRVVLLTFANLFTKPIRPRLKLH